MGTDELVNDLKKVQLQKMHFSILVLTNKTQEYLPLLLQRLVTRWAARSLTAEGQLQAAHQAQGAAPRAQPRSEPYAHSKTLSNGQDTGRSTAPSTERSTEHTNGAVTEKNTENPLSSGQAQPQPKEPIRKS